MMKQTVAQCYNNCLTEDDKGTRCSDKRTLSFVTHTAKIIRRILEEGRKGTWGYTCGIWVWILQSKRILRVISQRIFGTDDELCGCFIDW